MRSTITKMMGVCLIAIFSTSAMAQSNQISLGVDLGIPLGDYGDIASLIVGPTAGFELPVSDNIGITAQVGYQIILVNSDFSDFIASMSAIPFQAGVKYYVADNQEGLYIHAQAGMHAMSVKSEDIDLLGTTIEGETTTNTNFSWAIGAGFQMDKLDLGLRYNVISANSDVDGASSTSYIGVRAAYLINLGG